tara:strand:+ start:1962 stop:2267 length:306 start_codon:yes stop_codon:yes gene_type:complete
MGVDFKEGSNPEIELVFTDEATREPVNLTAATVTLRFRFNGGSRLERAMTITDVAKGVAKYRFTAGEMVAGDLVFDAEAVDNTGNSHPCLETFQMRVARSA